MRHSFNLKIDEKTLSDYIDNDIGDEKLIYSYGKDDLLKEIKSIIHLDKEKKEATIKHNDIIKNWFPDSECHIFMSHSHKDKKMAISIANQLFEKYKLKTFIDSDFWQFVDDAILDINTDYSKCEKPNDHLLRYDSCLMVGTNFYLTLSNALINAIDKSDCCIFLNTENSISDIKENKESTYSPWIYTELNSLETLRINDHKDRQIAFSAGNESALNEACASVIKSISTEDFKVKVEYEVDPSFKLPTIDSTTLGVILKSPEKFIENYKIQDNFYTPDYYNNNINAFDIKVEKVRSISYLDRIYKLIFSSLPKKS